MWPQVPHNPEAPKLKNLNLHPSPACSGKAFKRNHASCHAQVALHFEIALMQGVTMAIHCQAGKIPDHQNLLTNRFGAREYVNKSQS